ncbi:hypothetical protein SeLEV6574_g07753 [Synchytrium endobioticum]|uniref:Uncharacterized protein n=1 Tax=Synchytrium endobioticum TaxID=286115 RepID=A0A507CKQ6_9FUNG|nr:hypothetical protein SeLEV6574_g07753 [Synchytrium endobioticum]
MPVASYPIDFHLDSMSLIQKLRNSSKSNSIGPSANGNRRVDLDCHHYRHPNGLRLVRAPLYASPTDKIAPQPHVVEPSYAAFKSTQKTKEADTHQPRLPFPDLFADLSHRIPQPPDMIDICFLPPPGRYRGYSQTVNKKAVREQIDFPFLCPCSAPSRTAGRQALFVPASLRPLPKQRRALLCRRGRVCVRMLAGHPPFYDEDQLKLYEKILASKPFHDGHRVMGGRAGLQAPTNALCVDDQRTIWRRNERLRQDLDAKSKLADEMALKLRAAQSQLATTEHECT